MAGARLRQRWQGRLVSVSTLLACLLGRVMAEEEEGEPTNPVACSISVMLLGNIGFQMLLFYLVHWPDPDIRRYSWQVISQTISIFCAVLLFQAFNGIVEDYVIHGGSEMWEVLVDMSQLVFWLTALQVVLAVSSGAVNDLLGGGEPELEKVKLRLKSWSVLFSHLAGFSAINAWGSVQQQLLKSSPMLALSIVPIALLGLFVMYHGYDLIREYISHMDDGEEDEYEQLWDEFTEEAENDVAGLSLSFLTVQALRFQISGVMPNQEGGEKWADSISHRGVQWQTLTGCGVCFFMLSIIPVLIEQYKEPEGKLKRLVEFLNNYFTFGTAWSCFYGTKWFISSMGVINQEALLLVVIALFLSAASFGFIFILDKIEDNSLLGEDSEVTEGAIDKLIQALAVLIGFSWEQSFDTAVGVVASAAKEDVPPAISKLIMSLMLVVMVFPAWRMYILPTETDLTEEDDESFMLKQLASEHNEMFRNKEMDEHKLDLAHLKMKRHRREVLQLPLLGHERHSDTSGLKHLRVTSQGITAVDAPTRTPKSGDKKKKLTHKKDITEKLLGDD